MSEYADISIRKLSLCSFKNYLNSNIVSLFFSGNDLIVVPSQDDNLDLNAPTEDSYMYKTTVLRAKERFDALGYGINKFEKEFNDKMYQALDYTSFLHYLGIAYDDYEEVTRDRIRKKVTFKKWVNAMSKIITFELENGNIRWNESLPEGIHSTECAKVILYSMKDIDAESFYGIYPEIISEAFIFRLILENCAEDDEIVLDFSNLAYWADDCIPKALEATGNNEKIIVLVEGTSDKDILEYAMRKIYPHLSDLFYFMDFDDEHGVKRDGGTSYIIKNLKTFYFSKIKNKFIAIFDNDAEGYQSKCTLLTEIKNWPDNFRILLYPEMNVFRKYPTLASNGTIITDNINKKACSIELYLPDSLIKEQGEYYPIEWENRKKIKVAKGIEEFLYQGVISQKDDIKKKFHELRNDIDKGKENFKFQDWHKMKTLLDTIVFAFTDE